LADCNYNIGYLNKGVKQRCKGGIGVGGDFSVAVSQSGLSWSAGIGPAVGFFKDTSFGYFTGRIPWRESLFGILGH